MAAAPSALRDRDRELVLDRYRPLRPIGRGGSGTVWLARDEQSGLEVALKIVPREGKRAARATREMEAATRLRHVRCVRAYGFGEDEGHVYIAYEYLRGSTLRERIRGGDLRDREAVEAVAQVLDALAHAHANGIIHRDVKPSNVLLEDTPAVSVKLLDFGLAQLDEADTLTNVGDVPGTLAYISPERLIGAEATERSDVWAVGVMLWEALAGDHPFWGVPLPKVAGAIAAGAPPLADKRPDLPRRLLEAVDAALALNPAQRPTAAALAARLRAILDPRRPPAREPRRERSLRPKPQVRFSERLPVAVVSALAALAGVTLLPFWPGVLMAVLVCAAGIAALAAPRAGLAVALFVPVFPLGNLAQGAALTYAAVALVTFAVAAKVPAASLASVTAALLVVVGLRSVPVGSENLAVCAGAARDALAAQPLLLAAAAVVVLASGLAGRRLRVRASGIAADVH